MFKTDFQIDMFNKCLAIIEEEISKYDQMQLANDHQAIHNYTLPKASFYPMVMYMEEKYRHLLIPLLDKRPFRFESLHQLRSAFIAKVKSLKQMKEDHRESHLDAQRKNFLKSLDYRSFLYKEFIKKFEKKQYHLSHIKSVAWQNSIKAPRHVNLLKGGFQADSPFYHSFGNFVHFDFSTFDPEWTDLKKPEFFPLNMEYKNMELIKSKCQQKLPHLRMAFKDKEAVMTTIKLISPLPP
jgi:hypothetical protein